MPVTVQGFDEQSTPIPPDAKEHFPLLGGVAGEPCLLTGCLLELEGVCRARRQPRNGLKDRVLVVRIAVSLKEVGSGRNRNTEPGVGINWVNIARTALKAFGALLTDIGQGAARTSRAN